MQLKPKATPRLVFDELYHGASARRRRVTPRGFANHYEHWTCTLHLRETRPRCAARFIPSGSPGTPLQSGRHRAEGCHSAWLPERPVCGWHPAGNRVSDRHDLRVEPAERDSSRSPSPHGFRDRCGSAYAHSSSSMRRVTSVAGDAVVGECHGLWAQCTHRATHKERRDHSNTAMTTASCVQ